MMRARWTAARKRAWCAELEGVLALCFLRWPRAKDVRLLFTVRRASNLIAACDRPTFTIGLFPRALTLGRFARQATLVHECCHLLTRGRHGSAWKAAMRRAARYGDGWLPYMYTPEMLAESITALRRHGEDVERDLATFTDGIFIFFAVHEDHATAVKMAADKLGTQYAQDFTKLVPKYALAGDPAYCQARLREYIDAGARFVFVSTACPDDYINTNLELMAREVMPGLRRQAR